jgi:CBS domain-containing protein
MLVAGIMKRSVITINPLATVREALMMMKERGVKSLVVDKRHSGDAYGLIAYRDVARAVIADDGDIDLLNVYDIAQKPALQVSQHLEVRYLARLMIQYAVKSVLVIDNNDLQGFVSDTDVVAVSSNGPQKKPRVRQPWKKSFAAIRLSFPAGARLLATTRLIPAAKAGRSNG